MFTVALALGWFTRGWRGAASDKVAANNRIRAASRAVWRARRSAALVVLVALAAADVWIRKAG